MRNYLIYVINVARWVILVNYVHLLIFFQKTLQSNTRNRYGPGLKTSILPQPKIDNPACHKKYAHPLKPLFPSPLTLPCLSSPPSPSIFVPTLNKNIQQLHITPYIHQNLLPPPLTRDTGKSIIHIPVTIQTQAIIKLQSLLENSDIQTPMEPNPKQTQDLEKQLPLLIKLTQQIIGT